MTGRESRNDPVDVMVTDLPEQPSHNGPVGPDPENPPKVPSNTTNPPPPPSTTTINTNNAYDNEFFHKVVEDAGRWAYGVVMVEVWVLNPARTHLVRPDSGWWIDPYATDCGANSKWSRFFDATRDDYLEPRPLPPGCGLPGALYAEGQTGNIAHHRGMRTVGNHDDDDGNDDGDDGDVDVGVGRRRRRIHSRRRGVGRPMDGSDGQSGDSYGAIGNVGSDLLAKRVTWRDIKTIADDPDQPYNPRLKFSAESGLGWAAGIPFQVGASEGVVVYVARDSVNMRKLCHVTNLNYMTHATLLIGSAYALRIPRIEVENARRAECYKTMQRVKNKITMIRKMNKGLDTFINEESERPDPVPPGNSPYSITVQEVQSIIPTRCTKSWEWLSTKASATLRKCLGANVSPPPTFTWQQTAWTFFGAFVTLMILTIINKVATENLGSEYSIVLGPFGALMTLQYGLTAAPASQPRNAILGQIFALLIAHGIGQSTSLEPWFKQTLATSLAISMMVKCGVTHPPAGAAALLFSTGSRSWQQVGMMIVGNIVAIACATLFNNLSDRRQYPTFWGLRKLHDLLVGDSKDEEKEQEKKGK